MIGVYDLPAVNATLNGTAAILLVCGYVLIRSGRREAHRKVMLSAFTVSVLFLICYVTYHTARGGVVTRFEKTGPIRTLYFFILITHTGSPLPSRSWRCSACAMLGIPLRETSRHRTMDTPDLAVRQRDRRRGLPDAVPLLTEFAQRHRIGNEWPAPLRAVQPFPVRSPVSCRGRGRARRAETPRCPRSGCARRMSGAVRISLP